MIVSAFAGVGKTTLAQMYKEDVIDLESGNFKWLDNEGTENLKGNKKILNPKYPINYLEAIKKANSQYKVVLISQHDVIRKCLDAVKLDYIVVYPEIGLKEEFIERYRLRDNNDNFINLISSKWENWISDLNLIQNHKKIVINKGQYLSDFVEDFGLPKLGNQNIQEVSITDNKTEEIVEEIVTNIVETVDKSVENQVIPIVNKDITISKMMEDGFYIDD